MSTYIPLLLGIMFVTGAILWALWPRSSDVNDPTAQRDRTAANILLHAARRERQLAELERRIEQRADESLRAINHDRRMGSE
jgi:phage gp46-like protein